MVDLVVFEVVWIVVVVDFFVVVEVDVEYGIGNVVVFFEYFVVVFGVVFYDVEFCFG